MRPAAAALALSMGRLARSRPIEAMGFAWASRYCEPRGFGKVKRIISKCQISPMACYSVALARILIKRHGSSRQAKLLWGLLGCLRRSSGVVCNLYENINVTVIGEP